MSCYPSILSSHFRSLFYSGVGYHIVGHAQFFILSLQVLCLFNVRVPKTNRKFVYMTSKNNLIKQMLPNLTIVGKVNMFIKYAKVYATVSAKSL